MIDFDEHGGAFRMGIGRGTLTLLVRSPPVPGPDASLLQALTKKKRWKKKIPTATILRREVTEDSTETRHACTKTVTPGGAGSQRVKCLL